MDSLYCSLEGRSFQALLNGINKRLFYGESSTFTDEYLAEQLYSNIDIEKTEIFSQINAFEQLISKAAESNWDVSVLEDKLKRLTEINESHLKILLAFWTNEKSKIHDIKIKESRFNNSYNKLDWNIQVKAMSKSSSESNEPFANFDLFLSSNSNKPQKISFDMNKSELLELISSLPDKILENIE